MKKGGWAGWLILGGTVLLIAEIVKRGRSEVDAPGVGAGDVTYARYKKAWDEGKAIDPVGKFYLLGMKVYERTNRPGTNKLHGWSTFDGSYRGFTWNDPAH